MAISESNSGTLASASHSVGDSWTSLVSADTTDGVYQCWVDTANLVAGDTLEVEVQEKVISSGTARTVATSSLVGVQSAPAWVSPALVLLHGWTFRLRQRAGTARAFPWSVRKIA